MKPLPENDTTVNKLAAHIKLDTASFGFRIKSEIKTDIFYQRNRQKKTIKFINYRELFFSSFAHGKGKKLRKKTRNCFDRLSHSNTFVKTISIIVRFFFNIEEYCNNYTES